MKRLLKTKILYFLLIVCLVPMNQCFAFNTMNINQQILTYIEDFKGIYDTLSKNGEMAYSIQRNKSDSSQLKNSITSEVAKIDKFRSELEGLINNKSLSNSDRRISLIALIGIGYYKLAYNELNNFLSSPQNNSNFETLNLYFNFKYTGYNTLNWLELHLKPEP